jgi:hypothetical protein
MMKRINCTLRLLFIMALLLSAQGLLAAPPVTPFLEVSPTRQTVSLPDDPVAIYAVTLRNQADETQEFEIASYTPRYIGDPGFTHHFEYDGVVMPMVFYLTLAPGEEVPIVLVVTAYHSPEEVPEYWVSVSALGDIDAGVVDTYTIRKLKKGNKPF